MGLDSYFYKRSKVTCDTTMLDSSIISLFSNNDKLKEKLNRLNAYANNNDKSLQECLYDAINDYLNNYGEGYCNELLYFRKFHYLLDYFKYDDNWYARDMLITKEQCIELRNKAKACIDEIGKVSDENNVTICCYNYGANAYSTQSNTNVTFVDDIIYKHFPCEYKPKGVDLYSKVLNLYRGMNEIISETDWDKYEIIFNADW